MSTTPIPVQPSPLTVGERFDKYLVHTTAIDKRQIV